jgi:hypothetical protein
MKELSSEKRKEFELIKNKGYQETKNGYVYLTPWNSKSRKHYKRSRILLQLHLNKEFEAWEHVHHKDGDKTNDSIDNLELLENSEHNSLTHAGKKRKTQTP